MPGLIAFLAMAIKIEMGINPGAPGLNISRMVSEQYQKCWNVLFKKRFHGTVLEKLLMFALEKF